MPKTNENCHIVTIQQRPRCKEEACDVCCAPAHEQADDAADGGRKKKGKKREKRGQVNYA